MNKLKDWLEMCIDWVKDQSLATQAFIWTICASGILALVFFVFFAIGMLIALIILTISDIIPILWIILALAFFVFWTFIYIYLKKQS